MSNRLLSLLLIASLALSTSILVVGLLSSDQLVYANPCTDNPCSVGETKPVTAGISNTIFFRDVNILDNSTVTGSFDKSSYHKGQTATLTINDFDANLDLNAIDIITAQVNNVNLVLTETGNDTGQFKGSFAVSGSSISTSYPHPLATGRLKAELDDVTTSGTAQISDFIINDPNFSTNECFTPVVQPAKFTLVGTTIGPSGYMVNMSYANALLEPPVPAPPPELLQMYYKPVGGSWELITANAFQDPTANNGDSMTIVSDPTLLGLPPLIGSGLFTLGFDSGCGGGGGGGLVINPGLVFDTLAGVAAIGGSPYIVSPPSFGSGYYHYSDGLTFTQGDTKTTLDTSKYNQELPRQVMVPDTPVNMTFKTFESYNPIGVVHMGLYIIPRGQDMLTSNSLASIVWEKDKPVELDDPNHILSNASASSDTDGKFQYTKFTFVPTKSYDKMSFLARAWNDHQYSTDIRVHDDVNTPQTPYLKPDWLHIYDNLHDADIAVEGAGFVKPNIFSHVSTADQMWNQNGGTVSWFFDEKDQAVAVEAFDSNKNLVWSKTELLHKQTPQITQGPDASYAGNHLNRLDKTTLENAEKEEQKRVDTTLQMMGYPVYWNHSIIGARYESSQGHLQ